MILRFIKKDICILLLMILQGSCTNLTFPIQHTLTSTESASIQPKLEENIPITPHTNQTSVDIPLILTETMTPDIPIVTPTLEQNSTSTATPIYPTITSNSSEITGSLTPTLAPPSPTQAPTFSYAESDALINDLLENNGSCMLPCIFGYEPGRVNSAEILRFLSLFGPTSDKVTWKVFVDTFTDVGGIRFSSKGNIRVFGGFDFSFQDGSVTSEYLTLIAKDYSQGFDNELIFGTQEFKDLTQFYLLPNILSKLGQPGNILIQAKVMEMPAPFAPFTTVLVYPDSNLFIFYVVPWEFMDEMFVGCPNDGYIEIYAFADEIEEENFQEKKLFLFEPLSSATSITNEEFYENFSTNIDACISTPRQFWLDHPVNHFRKPKN